MDRHPTDLITAGFWIAIGFHVGTIAFMLGILAILFGLGILSGSDLRF